MIMVDCAHSASFWLQFPVLITFCSLSLKTASLTKGSLLLGMRENRFACVDLICFMLTDHLETGEFLGQPQTSYLNPFKREKKIFHPFYWVRISIKLTLYIIFISPTINYQEKFVPFSLIDWIYFELLKVRFIKKEVIMGIWLLIKWTLLMQF